jgi:hypothetical protein
MGADEEDTLTRLNAHRRMRPGVTKFCSCAPVSVRRTGLQLFVMPISLASMAAMMPPRLRSPGS